MIDAKYIGAQGLTVGMTVVVREATGLLRAGLVDSIASDGSPVITTDGNRNVHHGDLALVFVPAETVDEIEAMPPGSWAYCHGPRM